MSSSHIQVVVGFDLSRSGHAALYRAIALATRAPLHVLHFICVVEPHGTNPDLPSHGVVDFAYTERVQEALTEAITLELRAANAEGVHFIVHVRIGKPADEILHLAGDVGADLIIVGSKGLTGLERLVVGSVSEKVVREAGCTVEVARAKTYEYVALAEVTEVEMHHHYTPPHRYSYEENRVTMRPLEWPLY